MIASTLYIRVVPQDKDRGYMLLVGYQPNLTQTSAMQYMTLQGITRAVLDAAIARVSQTYNASEIKDMTPAPLKKKLRKMFGEPPEEV